MGKYPMSSRIIKNAVTGLEVETDAGRDSRNREFTVAECIDRVVSEMLRRRPCNGDSLVGGYFCGEALPLGILGENGESEMSSSGPGQPSPRCDLDDKAANPEGVNINLEMRCFEGRFIVSGLEDAIDTDGIVVTSEPDLHPFGDSKRARKLLTNFWTVESSKMSG
jgi:hypothetical protein